MAVQRLARECSLLPRLNKSSLLGGRGGKSGCYQWRPPSRPFQCGQPVWKLQEKRRDVEAEGGKTSLSTSIPAPPRKVDPLDLTFLNHNAAFKSKTTAEVIRAYIVFQLCSITPLVANNEKLMKLGRKILGDRMFGKLMKATFYGHFVAGEDRQTIKPAIHRLHTFGVKAILDYSAEEDISSEQAENLEMKALQQSDEVVVQETPNHGSYQDHIRRYQPTRDFGDRRKLVSSARTYFYQNEAQCEKNMETFLKCIEAVADATGGTGMAAIKMTALGRPSLLLQLSEVIVRARRFYQEVTGEDGFVLEGQVKKEAFENRFKEKQIYEGNREVQEWLQRMTFDKKGLIHLFSWSGLIDTNMLLGDIFKVPNLKTGKLEPLFTALTDQQEEQFRNMLNRLQTIFQVAKDLNVRVMVDAEQTYFQPAIHRLALEMMKKYNQEKAIVFNTYQCYLKIAYHSLVLDLEQASRQNFYFGAKLVRGAYMDQERARAASMGYEDPINPSYEATTEMYHKCLAECMRRMSEQNLSGDDEKRIGIMVASHNANTVRFAIQKMNELNIKPDERLICFGQLLGMCDNISFPLGQAGYSVYKYVPYGPVNEVLPYLSRRARENRGMLAKLDVEKSLLTKEIFDRIKGGKLLYTPNGDYIPVGFKSLPPSPL